MIDLDASPFRVYGYTVHVLQPVRVATHCWEFTSERVLLDGQLRYILEKRQTGHKLMPHPAARPNSITVDELHHVIYCTPEQARQLRRAIAAESSNPRKGTANALV